MERFQEILNQVAEIYGSNKDYAEDPLSNFRVCERMGIPAWKGVLVMMAEKMGRLMNIAKSESLEAEPKTVAATLTELAAHAIIARMLLEEPPSTRSPESGPRRGRRPGQKERKETPAEPGDALPGDSANPTGQE